LGATRIHISGEFFAPVKMYDLLETTPYTGQTDGKTYPLQFTMEMNSLVNVGLGVEVAPSESVSLFGSFRTDFSGLPDRSASNTAATNWDLYHLTGGTVLSFSAMNITLGISCAWGSSPLKDIPMFDEAGATASSMGYTGDAKARILTLTGILAFTFEL
jgi:hypothetical protein